MIHPIDRASALLLAWGPQRLRFFTGGWGEPDLLGLLAVGDPGPPAEIDIAWGPPREQSRVVVRDGTFPSPGPRLPSFAATAHVRSVEPDSTPQRRCLLMAAWNDHGYRTRTRLARRLAAADIGSVMLENPYYGERRPAGAAQPITTVADFATMGRAAFEEGRAVLAALRRDGAVGVSGYSMGGNLAALVGAAMPFPVAIAPLAPSHSPGPVYLDGVLRHGIDWAALGGEGAAAGKLREKLSAASVLALPPAAHTRHAVLVAARSDGYVPRTATTGLHRHWPGSELRWAPGGHATMLWWRKRRLVEGIVDAFVRLEAAG